MIFTKGRSSLTTITLCAKIFDISEDNIGFVRIERGETLVADVLHPEAGPGAGRHGQQKSRDGSHSD